MRAIIFILSALIGTSALATSWVSGSGPGSEYYWNSGSGPGSQYYWNSGSGLGSKYYYDSVTTDGVIDVNDAHLVCP